MSYERMKEITAEQLDPIKFIDWQIEKIASEVGDNKAINALSGGVDSSVVTMLGHKAIGKNLLTYVVENGLMREGELQRVVKLFRDRGVPVELIDESERFFAALKGITDPEEKREKGITQPFYRDVFGRLVRESGAIYLFQGTILTDVDETDAGLKRQHNVMSQIGIDPEKAFGYKIIEPLVQLRKDTVRIVAKALGLPEEIYNRMPFPGPALAARVIGEITPEKIETVRKATTVVEDIIGMYLEAEKPDPRPFIYMAILHEEGLKETESPTYDLARIMGNPTEERIEIANSAAKIVSEMMGNDYLTILHADRVTGMRDGKRDFGLQVEIRKKSADGKQPELPPDAVAKRITDEPLGVVSVVYSLTPNISQKPIDDGSQIEIRCWDSVDARVGTATKLPSHVLEAMANRITDYVPGVMSVTYHIASKPPSTMEPI